MTLDFFTPEGDCMEKTYFCENSAQFSLILTMDHSLESSHYQLKFKTSCEILDRTLFTSFWNKLSISWRLSFKSSLIFVTVSHIKYRLKALDVTKKMFQCAHVRHADRKSEESPSWAAYENVKTLQFAVKRVTRAVTHWMGISQARKKNIKNSSTTIYWCVFNRLICGPHFLLNTRWCYNQIVFSTQDIMCMTGDIQFLLED